MIFLMLRSLSIIFGWRSFLKNPSNDLYILILHRERDTPAKKMAKGIKWSSGLYILQKGQLGHRKFS